MKIKIRPRNGHVLIDPIVTEPTTFLIVPDSAKNKEMPQEGIVIATGGRKLTKKGVAIEREFNIGDKVLFRKFSGLWLEYAGQRFIHVGEKDIEAVLG